MAQMPMIPRARPASGAAVRTVRRRVRDHDGLSWHGVAEHCRLTRAVDASAAARGPTADACSSHHGGEPRATDGGS